MSCVETTSEAAARLRKLDVCAVSDALDRLKLPSAVGGLRQFSGASRIAGRVIAVRLGVGEPPDGVPRHLCSMAIERGGADDIIVVEQRTGIEAGSWGGLLSLGAVVRGIAGVIAEGPVRDIDEARGLGFPVFARSLTARTARGRVVELGTDLTLSIGGVRVDSGDYAIADNSGVAFIPAKEISTVLKTAEAIARREAAMADAIRAGVPIGQVMGGDYEHMLRA
jgi:4-hydroxy-4-methyl-2-oxoglutarate aldolase